MSFYQTNNSSIVRFIVHDPAQRVIAPFQTLQRVVQMQNIGQGYSGYYTGTAGSALGTVGTTNKSWLLTPEQLQNGAIIVNPTGASSGVANPYAHYTLPSAYSLQEYLGGRGAFNMAANRVNVGAGANPMTGLNDYFILNIYNISTSTGVIHGFDDGTNQKTIRAGLAGVGAVDAVQTPVLIQFNNTYSPYATINGVANAVSYTLY